MAASGYVDTSVVTEVNGETGDVDLSAADVGADAAGAGAAAVAALAAALAALVETGQLVVGENRFKVSAVGGLDWAGVGGPYDTNLYRDAAGQLLTEGRFTADQLFAASALVVGGQAVPAAPAWVAATLGTSIVKRTSTADPATSIERGRVFWRGTLQWATGLAVGAGYQLARVDAAHRPATEKSFSIRSIGAGSNVSTSMHLGTDGWLTPEVSLGTSSGTVHLPLDGMTWDLS